MQQHLSPTAAASQPAKSPARVINAEHLKLSLMARKAVPRTRWAAMSNGAHTSSCKRRPSGSGFILPKPPLLSAMDRGHLRDCIDRARSQGRREVLATWGVGIRALHAETASYIMRTGAAL